MKEKKVVFIHLDLGIGGAENLIINLALASLPPPQDDNIQSSTKNEELESLNAKVLIYTTHCSQTHCFSEVKIPTGILSSSVAIVGSFLPSTICGGGHALCSSLRILYASYKAYQDHPDADLFVLDVLPTSIPLLTTWLKCTGSVLFYCHFPDKLLTRDTVNGVPVENGNQGVLSSVKRYYRGILDFIEESTMRYADLVLVNSNFTRQEVQRVFPSLEEELEEENLKILYPPIDLTKFVVPNFDEKMLQKQNPIVSLNRFERKKNVGILLHAYALLRSNLRSEKPQVHIPPLIIAGGYDPRNIENVQHLSELKALASKLQIMDKVQFQPNVADTQRSYLLKNALCVVYTPNREHFGIVPIESMYAGSPVIAVNSGGPKETILDGKTGFLVENDDVAFMEAMKKLVCNVSLAVDMGKNGHEYVREKFGMEKFRLSWCKMVMEALKRGGVRKRRERESGGGYDVGVRFVGYMMEATIALIVAWVITVVLRLFGVVGDESSVVGEVRAFFSKEKVADEL